MFAKILVNNENMIVVSHDYNFFSPNKTSKHFVIVTVYDALNNFNGEKSFHNLMIAKIIADAIVSEDNIGKNIVELNKRWVAI